MKNTNTGSLILTYLEVVRQHGKQAVERELQQIGQRTNEIRRAKLATPVSWELLCSIVPENFHSDGHCDRETPA